MTSHFWFADGRGASCPLCPAPSPAPWSCLRRSGDGRLSRHSGPECPGRAVGAEAAGRQRRCTAGCGVDAQLRSLLRWGAKGCSWAPAARAEQQLWHAGPALGSSGKAPGLLSPRLLPGCSRRGRPGGASSAHLASWTVEQSNCIQCLGPYHAATAVDRVVQFFRAPQELDFSSLSAQATTQVGRTAARGGPPARGWVGRSLRWLVCSLGSCAGPCYDPSHVCTPGARPC